MGIKLYGGFPKLGVPFWGVPMIRTIVFWGLYCDPLLRDIEMILDGNVGRNASFFEIRAHMMRSLEGVI